MVTRKPPGDSASLPERLSDEEVARIRGRRAGVRASLACSGLFLTDEEERLLDEMEEHRLTLEQRDARVMEFIRAREGRTRDHPD